MILWVFPPSLEGFSPHSTEIKITSGGLLFISVPVHRKLPLVPRALYLLFSWYEGKPDGSSPCPQLTRTSFLVVANLTQNGNLKVRAVLSVVRLPGRYFRGLFKRLKEDHRSGKEVLSQTSGRLYWKQDTAFQKWKAVPNARSKQILTGSIDLELIICLKAFPCC